MTEKEIELLANLIVTKIVEKQKELDDDFIGKWVAAGGSVEEQDGVDLNIRAPETPIEGLLISKKYLENELEKAVANEDYVAASQFKQKIAEINKKLKEREDE